MDLYRQPLRQSYSFCSMCAIGAYTLNNKKPISWWGRQNAAPLKFDPRPLEAASSAFLNIDKCRPRNASQVDLPSSTHYANGYFRIIVEFKLHMQVHTCTHGRAQTLSDQVIASIVYDGRSGMSVVAFRNAPPINDLSCFLTQITEFRLRPPPARPSFDSDKMNITVPEALVLRQ